MASKLIKGISIETIFPRNYSKNFDISSCLPQVVGNQGENEVGNMEGWK